MRTEYRKLNLIRPSAQSSMSSYSFGSDIPMRIEQQHRDVSFLTWHRHKVVSDSIHGNTVEVTLASSGSILLSQLKISKLLDRFFATHNVNLRLVPHLPRFPVLQRKCTGLPFFIKPEASSTEPIPEHLFRCEGLPKIRRHPVLPNSYIEPIPLSLCPFRHGVERPWRIFCHQNDQLQRWRIHKREEVDADPRGVRGV